MAKRLGRLEEVDIRRLWVHEQYDFSEWIAKDENIELLNETIGLTLVDIDKEVYVGAYRCDLVGKDETTGISVVIENQLEATNHDHLGKIITYASGLDANVVVWIVKEAREEHKSAIEWLNKNMAKDISFFLLEIHAYKIGDSLPAPKFVIIEQPNDFIKSTNSKKTSDISETEANRLDFWERFNSFVTENGKPFNTRKASTDHWYNVAIGTSEAKISIKLINKDNYISVEIYINDNKDLYDYLYLHRDKIEGELGFALDWKRLDNKKASRIIYSIPGLDFDNKENYPELMRKVLEKTIIMREVFGKFVKSY